ncbi:hypothetical protein OG563_11580 [Nocardia vinacea]|uniref:Uncharacterized protein n=1 Tax=Nocardia vinacea TaxID=96468 RepID=A0ABZ1Z7G0_9NOCA|nr:hypothetical protein [Nocardia vinacea]
MLRSSSSPAKTDCAYGGVAAPGTIPPNAAGYGTYARSIAPGFEMLASNGAKTPDSMPVSTVGEALREDCPVP